MTRRYCFFPQADYKGQFFFDSRNEDLYIYDGNAYQPVTITSGEIIFAGTYDASTGDVVSVTSAGQASGDRWLDTTCRNRRQSKVLRCS